MRLALAAMAVPAIRRTVAERSAVIAGGRALHTGNDLLGAFPGVFGVKTGNRSGAGWCEVAAARDDGVTIYATILGSPSEAQRDADLERSLAHGLVRHREVDAVTAGRGYAQVALPGGGRPFELVAACGIDAVARVGSLLTQRVVAPTSVDPSVAAGEPMASIEIFSARRLVGRRSLVAARTVAAPGLVARIR